jgi:thiamine-phosphate pyrophosphorylase
MTQMALKAGIRWIQFRDKEMNRRGLYEEALELRKLTRQYDAFFIVNDYADIAAAVDADGVHLGQEDLPITEARKVVGKNMIIGVSTHDEKEALFAQEQGADYIGFGPVFYTETKDAGEPKGTRVLGQISDKIKIPVVAIGGVGLDAIDNVISSGAKAIAVASAILDGDIQSNAKGFINKLKQIGDGS